MKMKVFLQASLSFAFVIAVFGQGYVGRQRLPVDKPLVVTGPLVQDPFIDTGLDSLRGGGILGMPDHIKRIIGSTVTGDVLVGGMDGFPRHGGTLNENGMVNGWGADPNVAAISAVSMWDDPLGGAAFPSNYKGEELVFDPVLNRYVVKQPSIGHQIGKDTHVVAKTGGMIPGSMPISHGSVQAEHNLMKQSGHMAAKTIGAGVVDPISHTIDKQLGGGPGYIKPGSFGPSVVDALGHDIVKSGGMVAGSPVFGGHVPVDTHIGMSKLGTVNVGTIGVHDPGFIAHNVGKATLGADGVMGHNIAKSSGAPLTVGFMDPTGSVAQSMGVNPLATSGVGHLGVGSFGHMGHDIAKSSGGLGFPNGAVFAAPNPVHNVVKVGQSGIAQIGHDPLASSIGHGIAKQTVGNAARVVDMGSGGALSAGDPMAAAAAHGLAKESVHVAGKTLDIASSGTIGGRPGFGVGMDIFGPGAPVVHPPVVKKPETFPTGYGRRVI